MPTIEKQGYKYTEEFGYIPEDWNICNMDDITKSIASGKSYEFSANGLYNLYGSTGIIGKTNIAKYDGNYILVARVGANAGYSYKIKEKCGISDNTLIIDLKEKHNINFIFYALKYLNINKLIFGSGQPLITGSQLKQLRIQVPPLPEQEKIAEVLGDVDSLIDKTQQLINKKKDLKTATMQKLLTPKDDWVKSILGEYVRVQGGYSFNSEKFINNGIPIIRISNIYNDDVIIDNETVFYEPINISKEFIINKGDVLIAMSGATTGKVGMYRYKNQAYQNQRVGKFVAINKDTAMGYIKQFLKSHQFINELNKSIAQGAQPNISSKQIEEIELVIPSRIEQEQIATILSDMDSEIEALEKELNKYKDLKTGMMQQLLTGKVRLI